MKTFKEFKSVFKEAPFRSELIVFNQSGKEVNMRYSYHLISTSLLMFCVDLRQKYGFAFYVTSTLSPNSSYVDLVVYTTLS